VSVPGPDDAVRIAATHAGEAVREIARFPLGLAHYVYDVRLASGRALVVRLGLPRDAAVFAAAVRWSQRLRPLGVPLPALLEAAPEAALPYLVLERLPGSDLGEVYAELVPTEKRALAREIAAIQARVATLPEGAGFGYALSEEGPFAQRSWTDLLRAALARSRARIAHAGLVSGDPVGRVERGLARLVAELDAVRPRAFLDDTTTKNVIVERGRLRGIVDVDVVCYGDPLFTVALTRTALRSRDLPLDYVEYWCEELSVSGARARALHLYSALFCAEFLGELGLRFNRETPIAADPAQIARLEAALEAELQAGQLA
jgi:aminoglycoside phosphotransferase